MAAKLFGEGQDGLLKTNLLGNKGEDAGYQNGGNVEVVFSNSSPKHVMSQKFGNTLLYHSMFRQKAFNSFTSWMPIWGDMGRYICQLCYNLGYKMLKDTHKMRPLAVISRGPRTPFIGLK